ncbi:MAG: GFA family protein [Alphaproteobacteria bacterium]|nr:GFA family protein [Alphaproteobacteria bacterium]MCB9930650.1 GFA family protein [Alphaproteobacteria bacterium]
MHIDGQCFCGHVAYEAEADPARTVVCHCTDCQTHSASAFGVVVPVRVADFRLTAGTLKTWVKTAESGNRRALTFCPECGTRIHGGPEQPAAGDVFSLRVGTIRQRAAFVPQRQVWCRSRQPWTLDLAAIPGTERQGAR